MATGETKLSYLDVVDDIQDGDTVPILRNGKNYMSTGLAQVNADFTDLNSFALTQEYSIDSSANIDIPCYKEGYLPIGIVGINGLTNAVQLRGFYIFNSATADANVRVYVNASQSTSGTVSVRILYKKS